jgi:hypothetical protein
MRNPIPEQDVQRQPPAAMVDERGALMMFGWFVGSIVIGCFALSAVSMSLDGATATSTATLVAALR